MPRPEAGDHPDLSDDESVNSGRLADEGPADDADASDLEDEPPDESLLMGSTGVEEEVLAELARAEAELSDPNAPDEPPDEEGAQV